MHEQSISSLQERTVAEEDAITRLLQMDVQKLTQEEVNKYLYYMAKRRGLDPLTKPFDLIVTQGKRVLYANSGCADQLREINHISIEVLEEGPLRLGDKIRDDVYIVKVRASMPDGRFLIEVGGASTENQTGESLWHAVAKSYTRAQRRATLGLCGLGIPDVSELGQVEQALQPLQRRLAPPLGAPADLPQPAAGATVPPVVQPSAPPVNLPKAR